MHPLDSSLDASVHGHGHGGPVGGRRVVRRRSSIDNGLLSSANELVVARILSSSSDSSEKNGHHGGFFENYHAARMMGGGIGIHGGGQQRRLSLNLNCATNTTFLANQNTVVSNADKCDLDKDCHLYSNENYNSNANGNNTTFSSNRRGVNTGVSASLHSHLSKNSSRHSAPELIDESGPNETANATNANNANNANAVSDHDDDDSTISFDGSEDSFCEATGAEPANQEYMMQDLGASCFWNDMDLYPELQRRVTTMRTNSNESMTKPSKEKAASSSTTDASKDKIMDAVYGNISNNSISKIQDMSTDELDYEPSIAIVNGLGDNPQSGAADITASNGDVIPSYHTSTTDEDIDDLDDDDEGDLLFAMDNGNNGDAENSGEDNVEAMQFLQEELLLAETTTYLEHGEDEDDEEDEELLGVGAGDYVAGDGDFSSECESFCDADETERANAEYLEKDLGASCCWYSTDDLLVEMAEQRRGASSADEGANTIVANGTATTSTVGNGAIDTIAEEN